MMFVYKVCHQHDKFENVLPIELVIKNKIVILVICNVVVDDNSTTASFSASSRIALNFHFFSESNFHHGSKYSKSWADMNSTVTISENFWPFTRTFHYLHSSPSRPVRLEWYIFQMSYISVKLVPVHACRGNIVQQKVPKHAMHQRIICTRIIGAGNRNKIGGTCWF